MLNVTGKEKSTSLVEETEIQKEHFSELDAKNEFYFKKLRELKKAARSASLSKGPLMYSHGLEVESSFSPEKGTIAKAVDPVVGIESGPMGDYKKIIFELKGQIQDIRESNANLLSLIASMEKTGTEISRFAMQEQRIHLTEIARCRIENSELQERVKSLEKNLKRTVNEIVKSVKQRDSDGAKIKLLSAEADKYRQIAGFRKEKSATSAKEDKKKAKPDQPNESELTKGVQELKFSALVLQQRLHNSKQRGSPEQSTWGEGERSAKERLSTKRGDPANLLESKEAAVRVDNQINTLKRDILYGLLKKSPIHIRKNNNNFTSLFKIRDFVYAYNGHELIVDGSSVTKSDAKSLRVFVDGASEPVSLDLLLKSFAP
eukprot:Nk52_evm73s2192 gene=Nk52_evmTU73s2192